jgi:hypothetical protein
MITSRYACMRATTRGYALGSEEEALASIDEMGCAWQQTPGAREWLDKQARASAQTSARRSEGGSR